MNTPLSPAVQTYLAATRTENRYLLESVYLDKEHAKKLALETEACYSLLSPEEEEVAKQELLKVLLGNYYQY